MDYRDALEYLNQVQTLGIKLGLENMSRLLAGMGDPQQAYPAVAVAGTNGKGSTSAFLASILRSAGYRTGLYTSPHLVRYEERIAVDGRPVTEEQLCEALAATRDVLESLIARGQLASHPTHFEILTAAAFHHFRRQRIQVGVLEVGMGGRMDAVATARTSVAVITNVSLEHTKFLGDTVEEIAAQKAGIIREGCYVVTGETQPEALAVIRREAQGRGVRVIERHMVAQVTPSRSASTGRFGLVTPRASYGELILPLAGRHQVENATLAVLAAEALCEAGASSGPLSTKAEGFEIPVAAVVEGLARTHWPGRLQIAGHNPLLLLDGAHNPAGCAALARALRDMREAGAFQRICLVLGVLQDKELEPMLRSLLALEPRLVLTRGRSERFRSPDEMAAAARAFGCPRLVIDDVGAAIETARSWASPQDAICVCGSLYLVGDAMQALGLSPY